jgi:hypothetical protein
MSRAVKLLVGLYRRAVICRRGHTWIWQRHAGTLQCLRCLSTRPVTVAFPTTERRAHV